MIATACPKCGKKFKLADDSAGKRAKCACGMVFTIAGPLGPAIARTEQPPTLMPAAHVPTSEHQASVKQVDDSSVPTSAVILAITSVMQAVRDRYVVLREMKHFRLISIASALVAIFGGIFIYEVQSYRANARQQVFRQIEENARRQTEIADQLWKKGDADIEEAKRLRAQASELRTAREPTETSESAPRQSRTEAMEDDAVIGLITDRFPDLRPMILNGDTALGLRLNLLMSTGNLTAQDVRYVLRFSSQIQRLPR